MPAPFTYHFNEVFYTSATAAAFPASSPSWSALPDDPSPRQLQDRILYSSNHPYLPYILKSLFHSDLLLRLSVPLGRIQLIYDTHGWHLTRRDAKDWKALENSLDLAAKSLLSFFQRNHPNTPLSFHEPHLPSKYGYFDTHESESAARVAISLSLDAFAVYLGYFSFVIAICQFGIDVSSPTPSWHKLLSRQDSGVHPEWLKLLTVSPIVNFSREHIGVITDVTRCGWLHVAQYMLKATIPLWFSWGKVPYYVQPSQSWISDYSPDLEKFTEIVPVNAGLYPPVHPTSGQRHSETMEQFFARCHARDVKSKNKETPRECEICKAREQAQASKPYPGKKGPSVFSWDDQDGFRVRTPIPRNQVERLWNARCKPTEKIYNAIDNCWDCCSIFGDNSLPGEPDPSDSDSDIELPMVARNLDGADPLPSGQESLNHPTSTPDIDPLPSGHESSNRTSTPDIDPLPSRHESSNHPSSTPDLPMDLTLISNQPTSSTNIWSVDVDPADRHSMPVVDTENTENDIPAETENLFEASSQDVLTVNAFQCVSFTSSQAPTVEDLIYYRFGFSLNEHPYSGLPGSISVLFRNWEEVVSAVGGQTLDSSRKHRQIMDFLGCLLSSRTPFQDVPGKFWDLSPDGADPLHDLPIKFLCIEKRQFNDETRYFLRPVNLHTTRDVSWVIAVNALTALECIRLRLSPHTLDTAKYLVQHGIPFLTLDRFHPVYPITRPPSAVMTCLLGYRPKGYKFNLADYAAYMTLRHSYLNSQPHAHAVLCVGGIVARLERESLSEAVGISWPSQEALDGKQLVLTSDGEHFCDDQVSEAVLDLICGVYQVETGNKDQVALVSWFPRHNIWVGSGLNVGPWTHQCEEWYTKRVEAIQNGKPPLRQLDWRELIRYTRKGPKLVYHMNLAAATYIDQNS